MAVRLYYLLFFSVLQFQLRATESSNCDNVNDRLTTEYLKIFNQNYSTVRRVDLEVGDDEEGCLNANGTSEVLPPCRSLEYALHGDLNESEGITPGVIIHVGPGVYTSGNRTTRVVDTERVAFLGAGPSKTIIVCGANGTDDVPCLFPNFQIRSSTHILVSGITFTGCGPVTSSFYVGTSDYVFIENCVFENQSAPASLFYNTPNVRISNCTFLNNHPVKLDQKIVHDTCYRPLAEVGNAFFIDNRTSGGGISYYHEDTPINFVIDSGVFVDNNARPDLDVGLIRRSEVYGHGGAVNIRLLNSTNSNVCIQDSKFLKNFAEAHAGALAITIANSSDNNIVVEKSLFEKNRCEVQNCTGGAVGIYLFSNTLRNEMLFAGCNFTSNKANSSGAVVLSTSVSANVVDGKSDVLKFRKCRFVDNRAFYEGTALGAFSLTHTNLIGIPVVLSDCLFYKNQGTQGSRDTTAVTVYRVLLTLRGNTSFFSNQGGGVTLLSSRMDVRGDAEFDGNTAVFGAGVAMAGRSLMLLHENSSILFSNNIAYELGAGLYVEDPSSDFTLSILNTGCFVRYNTSQVDIPPYQWNTSVVFKNNTAFAAGAAIYANDVSRCRWLGTECRVGNNSPRNKSTIFDLHPDCSPFEFVNNTVDIPGGGMPRGAIANQILATDPTTISANTSIVEVGYGEMVAVSLSSQDDQGNFREAVWSINGPSQDQSFGALSSNNTLFTYVVPRKSDLLLEPEALTTDGKYINFSVTFTLLLNESSDQSAPVTLSLSDSGCHPGYMFDNVTQICTCGADREIIRCDSSSRYFYTRDGLWVGVENKTVYYANTVPGFLECRRVGTLPGCEFQFDDPDQQCATGRSGLLCGRCKSGLGVTFDLRYCRDCNVYGLLLFLFIIIITPILSLAILYFDFPLPNELKGVIFYAQVVGVIYRSTPYLNEDESSNAFFDFIVNVLGFAMPFPLCMHENLSVIAVAFLGYVPPLLAMLTAFAYWFCARYVKVLSHREQYGFHGFYFLLLIVYKYIIDTSFIFVSCTNVNGKQVFLYQGELECYKFPFVLVLVVGCIMLVVFGVVLPLYVLKLIYAPGKMIYVRNALTHGLKHKRRYLWYGVWDIWRRLLFVAASLFISITTRSVVLLIHCGLILFCLWVVCFVRPYKKYYINMIEVLMILALFSTTLSVYDRENDFHVGSRVGFVTFAVPYIFGVGFILYRIGRLLWTKFWPMLNTKHMMKSKLDNAKKKCLDLANNVKGKTVVLVNKHSEDVEEIDMRSRTNTNSDETFSAELRESLLEENTRT